jgi:hypothetical protein
VQGEVRCLILVCRGPTVLALTVAAVGWGLACLLGARTCDVLYVV